MKRIVFCFLIILSGCTPEYMVFRKALNDYSKNKITKLEYDRIMDSYYVINKSNFKSSPKLKLKGTYVFEKYDDWFKKQSFHSIKFADSLYSIHSYLFYELPSNEVISKTSGVKRRYTDKEGEIMIEDLTNKDFELENIGRFAKISDNGDTLTFYKFENLRERNFNRKPEKIEKYIYYPEITAIPILRE
jgi:hypothetical protein